MKFFSYGKSCEEKTRQLDWFNRIDPALKRMIIMRFNLVAFLVSLTIMNVCASAKAQHITLSVKNASLIEVLNQIKQQSGYQFLYSNTQIENSNPITLEVQNKTLKEVLDMCFENQPIAYQIVAQTIVIKSKSEILKENRDKIIENIFVSGTVTDEKGQPLERVSVKVKGSNKSTYTDKNGHYKVEAEINNILEFSFIGFQTQEINVSGRVTIIVTLKEAINELDQVKVIAYGTTTKRLNTGNISIVNNKTIEKQPVSNALLALQGQIPGVFITQNTGFSSTGVTVRIRGQNSISNGKDPFYVIDGVPFTAQLLPGSGLINGGSGANGAGGTSPFTFINPGEIESISILKDADATAIYGSRAANGAILISTKKGSLGKTKVDLNLQNGWGKVARKINLMNSKQYLEMRTEALKNDNLSIATTDYDLNGTWDNSRFTDWQEELIGGTAQYQDGQFTISGGNVNTQFLIGSGYHRETTVFPGDFSDNRASVKFNINHISDNKRFKASLSGSYMDANNKLTTTDLTPYALQLSPIAPALYQQDGSLNWQPDASGIGTWQNPMTYLKLKYNNHTENIISNSVISYNILPELELKTALGYTNLQSLEYTKQPSDYFDPYYLPTLGTNARTYNVTEYGIRSWIIEPQINFTKSISQGNLSILLGSTFQKNSNDSYRINSSGYSSDLLLGNLGSATVTSNSSINEIYKYNALFGRITYNWMDKYIINLAARRDGSSRFGPKNQFHNFGSLGLAWVFTKEAFTKNNLPFLSFGKIRASYGTTGNDQLPNYSFLDLYQSTSATVPYQGAKGLFVNKLYNPYLAWEETRKAEIALELGFFKDALLFNINYYDNRSSNQLLGYALPLTTGMGGIIRNIPATIQNNGLEFEISTSNIRSKNFTWSSNFNISIPKNKLISYPDLDESSSDLILGKPITVLKKFQAAGVNSETGLYQFINNIGELTNTPNYNTDRITTVNSAPKYYGGLQNSFTYHKFQFNFLFQFVKQSGSDYTAGFYPGTFAINQPIYQLNRWQQNGDLAAHMRYNSNFSIYQNYYDYSMNSNGNFSDASYVRLKNASFSWQIPESWLQKMLVQSGRLYIQGQNLLTITNFKGLDPENQSTISLPPLKIITIGLQATF